MFVGDSLLLLLSKFLSNLLVNNIHKTITIKPWSKSSVNHTMCVLGSQLLCSLSQSCWFTTSTLLKINKHAGIHTYTLRLKPTHAYTDSIVTFAEGSFILCVLPLSTQKIDHITTFQFYSNHKEGDLTDEIT